MLRKKTTAIRRLIILLLIIGCEDNSTGNKISLNSNFETILGMDEFGNPTELIGTGNWGGCYKQNFYR